MTNHTTSTGTSRPAEPMDLHDHIDELTRSRQHAEPRAVRRGTTTYTENWVTTVPSLVHQLLGATPSGSGAEAGSSSGKSRPAARIEAVDTLMLIDDEAARWIRRLGHDDPGNQLDQHGRDHAARPETGSGTIACLTKLHGIYPSTGWCERRTARRDEKTRVPQCCERHLLEHDVRRWWQQARVITGWDVPAYRPWNTCPVCEHRGGLRVNLTMQTGLCIECRSIWGPEILGVLAEHIRTENAEPDAHHDGAA